MPEICMHLPFSVLSHSQPFHLAYVCQAGTLKSMTRWPVHFLPLPVGYITSLAPRTLTSRCKPFPISLFSSKWWVFVGVLEVTGHKRGYLIWSLWKILASYLTWIPLYIYSVPSLHHKILIRSHNTLWGISGWKSITVPFFMDPIVHTRECGWPKITQLGLEDMSPSSLSFIPQLSGLTTSWGICF